MILTCAKGEPSMYIPIRIDNINYDGYVIKEHPALVERISTQTFLETGRTEFKIPPAFYYTY
jgi:hypothetical protein